jgi:hypothetical protein
VRPVLKPALRRLWRGDTALQLGADPRGNVVLDPVDPTATALLSLLDGTRDQSSLVADAAALGAREGDVIRLLDVLGRARLLDDASRAPRDLRPLDRARLEPDLATLTLLTTSPGDAASALDRRRSACVVVVGAGRIGSLVASLLAAAGVGAVRIRDDRSAEPCDAVPGGLLPRDDGQPRALAAVDAARRCGAADVDGAVRSLSADDCDGAALAVVSTDSWLTPPPGATDLLAEARVPYLLTGVRETYGVVGPLVLPGRTSCERCHDLHRAEHDPCWPMLAAQLATDARGFEPSCDVTLAAGVAALTAGQVLAHLVGPGLTRAVDATLELRLPEWMVRRRTWTPHPDCSCGAAASAHARSDLDATSDPTLFDQPAEGVS